MALSRSEQMSRIRGKDTEPELLLRRVLRSGATGVRLGRIQPDLVFSRARVAVFVDGCFWHGCPDHYVSPRGNAVFWSKKLTENTSRDTRQTHALMENGWSVVRFWEHEVRADPKKAAARIRKALASRRSFAERWRVVGVESRPDELELRTERRLLRPEQWRIKLSARMTAKTGRVRRKIVRSGIGERSTDV